MNFSSDSSSLRLYKPEEFIEETKKQKDSFRHGSRIFFIKHPLDEDTISFIPGKQNNNEIRNYSSRVILGPLTDFDAAVAAANDFVSRHVKDIYVILLGSTGTAKS